MAGEHFPSEPTVPDNWQTAWLTRHSNPVVIYGETIRARSQLSIPIYRRHAFTVIVGGGSIVTFILFSLIETPDSVGEFLQQLLLGVLIAFLIVLVAYFLEGIFQLIVGATALLAVKPQRDGELQLDSMLAGTILSERELLVGFLYVLLKPLKKPVILLAASAAIVPLLLVWADAIINSNPYDMISLMALSAPFTGLGVLLTSAGSITILALWFIITGYGSRFALAGPLGGISYCGGQTILALSTFLSAPFILLQEMDSETGYILLLLLVYAVAAIGWLAGAITLGCYLAQRWPGFGVAYALLLPLCLPGNLIITGIIMFQLDQPDVLFPFMAAQLWSWTALVPFNPLATPTPMSYGISGGLATLFPGILLFTSVVFVQFVLLTILQAFARSAVRLRRSSFGI